MPKKHNKKNNNNQEQEEHHEEETHQDNTESTNNEVQANQDNSATEKQENTKNEQSESNKQENKQENKEDSKPSEPEPSKQDNKQESKSEEKPVENKKEEPIKKESENQENFSNQHQDDDKLSDNSNDSDDIYEEFFSGVREENAKRIMNQIKEMPYLALDYLKLLIVLGRNFEKMRKNLDNPYNHFFSSIFSFLGYNYKSNIPKINFFVFAAQAWLVEVSKTLDTKFKENQIDQNVKFSELLNIIKEIEINETEFLNILGIFTGSSIAERHNNTNDSSVSFLIENNIGKVFLTAIAQIFSQDISEITKLDLDKRGFEETMQNLLRKAVEKTLNEMENQLENQEDAVYYEFLRIFEELKEKNVDFTLEEYSAKIDQASSENKTPISSTSLQICSESFYNFAKIKFDEIIKDIKLFNRSYTSIVYKAKSFLNHSFKNVLQFNKSLTDYLKFLYESMTDNLRLSQLNEFYNWSTHKVLKKSAQVVVYGEKKANNMRDWLATSYLKIKEAVDDNKMINFAKEYPKILYQVYLDPLVEFSLTHTANMRHFVINKLEIGVENYNTAKEKVTKLAKEKINNVQETIQNIDLSEYVKLEENEEKTAVRFTVSKKLMIVNPDAYKKVVHYVNDTVKDAYTTIGEKKDALMVYSKDKSEEIKAFIISQYKKFLANEENKDKKETAKEENTKETATPTN